MTFKNLVFVLVLGTMAVITAACSGGGHSATHSTTTTAATSPRDADVAFLQGMIPHHRQALTMAQAADSKAASAEVRALADRIEQGQTPEIERMRTLLGQLGAAEVTGEHADHVGHAGMLTDAQLQELQTVTGGRFDQLFIAGMIEHHNGAITSAEKVLAEGENSEVKALAQQIIATQRAEVAELQALR